MDERSVLRRTASSVKRRAIDGRKFISWLGGNFLTNPGFAVYSRRQGNKNYAFFSELNRRSTDAQRAVLAPVDIPDMPRIIWIYWHQGEASAPYLVRRCIETWRERNPGWDVRVMDAQSVGEHVDTSDMPSGLSFRYNADLLRVRLLNAHGGVWVDATNYCHRPLDEWIWLHMTGGFFVFRNAGPDRLVESWFIASVPHHILTRHWAEDFTRYMKRHPEGSEYYFIFFYILQWRILRDREAGRAFDQIAGLPAMPALIMMEALKGIVPKDQILRLVRAGLPVSKLSRHTETDAAAFDLLCSEIDARWRNIGVLPADDSVERPVLAIA